METILARRANEPLAYTPEETTRTYRRIGWRIMPFLLLCYVVSFLDRVNLSFAKLQFMQDLGFSDAVYGLGAGIFYLSYVIFEVPSNLYMQRVGARATLMRIMMLWGAITSLMFLVSTPTQLYIARFALGAAEAGFFPGVILYLTYWFPSAYRARMMSIFLMGIPVSGLLGGPIAGWIMHDLAGLFGLRGWQLLFVLEGLPAVVLGVAAWFVLGENVKSVQWLSPHEKAIVTSQLELEQRQPATHGRAWMREVLGDPRMYAAILGYFAITCATVAISFWVPTIIKTLEVADVRVIGWLSALPYLAATIGLWAIGRHSDRTQERRWHTALSLIGSAAGFMLLGQVSQSLPLTLAMLAVAATGLYGAIPVFWAIPTAYLSRTAAPGGIALISSIGCLGAFSSTAIIGAVKSLTGSLVMAMSAVGVIMVAAAIVLLIAFPQSLFVKPRESA